MTRRSPNRRNPHDDPVDCPDRESGVFVYRREGRADGWQCGLCGWKSWIHGEEGVGQELVADGGWPSGDPCPECGELMDVGAVGNPGETITWQECEDCGIGWGPFTGFVDTDRDESLDRGDGLLTDGGVETDRLRVERSSAITYGPAVDAEGYVLAIGTADRRVEIELDEDAMYTLWTEVKGTPWPEPDHIGEKDRLVRQVLHAANGAGRESLREALRVLGGERS
jgi:hypothetical protein